MDAPPFAPRGSRQNIERGTDFAPLFGPDGLLPCIVSDHASGMVLMFAYMNAEALRLTLQTGTAHFWSRSRKALWKKGETSGETMRVMSLLTDCDQDAVWLRVVPQGRGAACHTGRTSCFYREVALPAGTAASHRLTDTGIAQHFDPRDVYGDD